jgi:hypothetical protein
MKRRIFGNWVLRIVLGTERGNRWAEWGKKDEQGAPNAEGRTEICAKSWSLV